MRHYVPGDVQGVFAGFTRELFERLAPKLPPSELLRYDGNAVGDEVHIRLGVAPLTQTWVSRITAHDVGAERASFVDEGERLPPPLTYWRHRHLVEAAGPGRVAIVEDVTYATPSGWLTAAMRPIVRGMFEARAGGYAEYFGKG